MIHGLLAGRAVIDIFWLLFLVLLFYFVWARRRISLLAQHWPTTKGTIEAFDWSQDSTEPSELSEPWIRVSYTYQVGDQSFQGDSLFLDRLNNNRNSSLSRKIAYRIAVAFKNEETVDIFYNPDNPEESAIDVHVPRKLNIILVLLGFFILLHLWH